MRGVVRAINARRGMVAIATDGHGHTIIEISGSEDIEVGDEMSWSNDTGLGSEVYTNVTKGQRYSVYVQNHWVPESQLRQQLLL